jgi:hypothetical protein
LSPRNRTILTLHYQEERSYEENRGDSRSADGYGEDESLPREGAFESYHEGADMDNRLPEDAMLDEALRTPPEPRRRWFWPAMAAFSLVSFMILSEAALHLDVEHWLIQPPMLLTILSIEIVCSIVLLWRARA